MKKPDLSTPGGKLRAARMARDEKIADFAESVGLSRSHINKMELNQDLGGRDAWKKVAGKLGLPIDYFLPPDVPDGQVAKRLAQNGPYIIEEPAEIELIDFWRDLTDWGREWLRIDGLKALRGLIETRVKVDDVTSVHSEPVQIVSDIKASTRSRAPKKMAGKEG